MTAVERPSNFAPVESARRPNRRGLIGVMHVRQDRATSWLALLFGTIAVAMVTSLWLGRFARTETVRGFISAQSGVARLDAQTTGVVRHVLVRQGDTVKAGQRLMVLQPRDQTSRGVSPVEAEMTSLTRRRENLIRDIARIDFFLDHGVTDEPKLRGDKDKILAAVSTQQRDIRAALNEATAAAKKVKAYVQIGYATRETLAANQRIVFDYTRQLSELDVKRAELDQQTSERIRAMQLSIDQKKDERSQLQNTIHDLDSQLAQLRTRLELDVVAPTAGTVAVLPVQDGATVAFGDVVAVIGDPQSEPLVVLDAPARAVGLAKVGQRVVLKYDAFPFKTFGIFYGTITAISSSPIKAPSVEPDGMADPRPVEKQSRFRVDVRPDTRVVRAYGEDVPIALGSTLTGEIVVERRRLIDWVLDPVKAMQGRG